MYFPLELKNFLCSPSSRHHFLSVIFNRERHTRTGSVRRDIIPKNTPLFKKILDVKSTEGTVSVKLPIANMEE